MYDERKDELLMVENPMSYYPEDVALVLAEVADLDAETENQTRNDLEAALAHVKAAAENPMNADYWRTLWTVLATVTENIGVELPF